MTLNQYAGGNREAGVEYAVYFDRNKDGRPGDARTLRGRRLQAAA